MEKCEVCGNPATCGVRDIKRRDNFKTGFIDKKPYGAPHFFCNHHLRQSREIDMSISPLNSDYNDKF